jgi:hypothetical protein
MQEVDVGLMTITILTASTVNMIEGIIIFVMLIISHGVCVV